MFEFPKNPDKMYQNNKENPEKTEENLKEAEKEKEETKRDDDTIKIWEKDPSGHYNQVTEISKDDTNPVDDFQVRPDGRIVSGSDEKGHKIKEIEKDKEGNIRESHE